MSENTETPAGNGAGNGGKDGAAPTVAEIAKVGGLFTRSDKSFRFARWGRPLAEVVYGTNEEGAAVFAEALKRVAGLAGLETGIEDEELGANFMVFLVEDWRQLSETPNMDKLIPDLDKLVSTLQGSGANQYRIFAFDETGAVKLCITLLRYDEQMQAVAPQAVALSQAVMGMLLWSDNAFTSETPVAQLEGGRVAVKPWFQDMIRAAYADGVPAASDDPVTARKIADQMVAIRAAR